MSDSKAITPIKQVCDGLQKMEAQLKQTLPVGMSVDRFIRTATNAIQMHPQKEKLASADRQSLYLSCQKAASDGLMLDGREAALVVFGDQVQYMPMTQGLVKLARNSGEIGKIGAWVVYSKDKFTYRLGLDEAPTHEPDWASDDRGEPIGVWYLIKLTNGEVMADFLHKRKIMKIAAKSKNAYQYDPEKGPYFDEWWKKTAIKNGLKYAPKSTELEKALARDELEFEDEVITQHPEPKAEKQTKAAKVVKADPEPEIVEAEIVEETPTDQYQDDEIPV